MRNECDIVKDLLPLYAEGLTSKASNAFVEEHLKTCQDCPKILKQIREEPLPEENASQEELPMQAFAKTYRKKKRSLAVLIAGAAASVLIALYAWLSTPQYLHYSEAVATAQQQPSGLLIHFTDAVHHVSVTEYGSPDDESVHADVECWTSALDRLWHAPAAAPVSVSGDVIWFRDNYKNSPGRIMYGESEGYSISLRRLTLNYYFWLAALFALIGGIFAFLFRKQKAGGILKQAALIPLSWCLASVIVERGISASTWSLTRDFSLIVLLCISLSVLLISLYRRHEENKALRI